MEFLFFTNIFSGMDAKAAAAMARQLKVFGGGQLQGKNSPKENGESEVWLADHKASEAKRMVGLVILLFFSRRSVVCFLLSYFSWFLSGCSHFVPSSGI